jgi:hypothetical protein
VKANADEYRRLTEDQKKALIADFEKNKVVIAKGTRVSARSKVNHAVRTISAVENLVNNYNMYSISCGMAYVVFSWMAFTLAPGLSPSSM